MRTNCDIVPESPAIPTTSSCLACHSRSYRIDPWRQQYARTCSETEEVGPRIQFCVFPCSLIGRVVMPTAKDLEVTSQCSLTGFVRGRVMTIRSAGPVELHETHISWVFLAGDYAYKVKKPITNDFLDYGSLALRKRMCEEELRLDARYSEGLYLGVVPITAGRGPTAGQR